MTLAIIDGGDGTPAEPNWELTLPGRSKIAVAEREVAALYWREIVTELRQTEKLACVNGHQVKRLVIAYLMYDRAAAKVARLQPVILARKTKTPMHNPWWTAMNNADAMAASIEAELTITPRRRTAGGKVVRRERRSTGADAYLKQVKPVGK